MLSAPAKTKWAPIPGFEGSYEASDSGAIANARTGKRLRGSCQNHTERLYVQLHHEGRVSCHGVSGLILKAFRGAAPGKVACHRNGDTQDNRLDNLYWGSRSDLAADRAWHQSHPGLPRPRGWKPQRKRG